MDYFELAFQQFHRIEHAHTMSQDGYRYQLVSGRVLEIGVVEHNPLSFCFEDGRCLTVNAGDVYIVPPGSVIQVSAMEQGRHTHTSVEFLIDCTVHITPEEKRMADDRRVLLPWLLPAACASDALILLIRCLARDRMYMTEKSYFEECQAFMQILSVVSRLTCQNAAAKAIPPAHRRYCQRAKEYITQNISRHVGMEELAGYVGVSKNYLTNVFSATEKTPLSEYMNRVKLNHMLELIDKYGASFRQASEAVGFNDVNYVSRMFRKYYGVTLSEYKQMLRKSSSNTEGGIQRAYESTKPVAQAPCDFCSK